MHVTHVQWPQALWKNSRWVWDVTCWRVIGGDGQFIPSLDPKLPWDLGEFSNIALCLVGNSDQTCPHGFVEGDFVLIYHGKSPLWWMFFFFEFSTFFSRATYVHAWNLPLCDTQQPLEVETTNIWVDFLKFWRSCNFFFASFMFWTALAGDKKSLIRSNLIAPPDHSCTMPPPSPIYASKRLAARNPRSLNKIE